MLIYPIVNEALDYLCGDKAVSGKDIKENGIRTEALKENSCQTINLSKI